MVNRFACAASGLLEEYYFKQGPPLFMRPLQPRFSYKLRGKINPGGSSQRLRCGTAISARDYQRRRQLHRETVFLQFIERRYWCLLCLLWILMLVKRSLGLRPILLVSFEPYENVIHCSKIHLKMVNEKCIWTYDAPCRHIATRWVSLSSSPSVFSTLGPRMWKRCFLPLTWPWLDTWPWS